MAALALTITKPANGQVFTSPTQVPLAGRVDSVPSGPLFYAWYSSLYVAPDPVTDAALHRPADPQTEVTKPLEVGTHVLMFTAKNVAGDDKASVAAVTEAGMAGGPPGTPNPCLVTVLAATLVQPTAPGSLSKANATLAVKAPVNWDQPGYPAVNRVGFTFTFTSSSTTVPFTPAVTALVFDRTPAPPKLRYTGPLPASLALGAYQLRARVFDLQNTATVHDSAPLAVTVTA